MLKVILVGFVVFVAVVIGVDALPFESGLAQALSTIGNTLIRTGRAFAEMFQFPVTGSLYALGHRSFATVQDAAVRDRMIWIAAATIWSAIGLFAIRKPAGRP